ncbi:hypothetical protein GCM10022419_135040 [Nonomuraea rosea]|uniref:Uncharacterized protein n=1 Tax=Nonomuraea rosea TaxID=638574 RepID=A0ABP7A7Q0_9ACTN
MGLYPMPLTATMPPGLQYRTCPASAHGSPGFILGLGVPCLQLDSGQPRSGLAHQLETPQ